MFNPWPAARRALASLRPPPNWFLGRPQRATIAAVNPAGYILLIDYTNGRDWVDLPGREQDWTNLSTRAADERPSDDELTAPSTSNSPDGGCSALNRGESTPRAAFAHW
jgi:hypothetical protein